MVVEHHREKHFNADKLERLNFTIREFDIRNYKQLGRLFGMEENQFRTIGELETLLKSLRTKSTSKTASAQTEETEKAFLNTQINMLNQYKNYLLTEVNQREKERNLKKQACRQFLRNLPGLPSPRKGQKQATSMPAAPLAALRPLDFSLPA